MKEYGYQILQALVTDMDPDRRVKEAMNEINASKRLREAASNKAEADKIMQASGNPAQEKRSLRGDFFYRRNDNISFQISSLDDAILLEIVE